MKTYKQLTEVFVTNSIKKTDANEFGKIGEKTNKEIAEIHTPVSSSQITGRNGKKYDVTVAKPKYGDDTHRTVFVHHNGEHVGSVRGAYEPKTSTLTIDGAGLHQNHQGHDVMSDVYKDVIHNHNINLKSADIHSVGGHKIWNKLKEDPKIKIGSSYDDSDMDTRLTATKKK